MDYRTALERLDARGFGIKPGLERIRALVELLAHPELSQPVIHLAGTNGKSTTARMIARIFAAHGMNVGVYLSPHIQSVRERFRLVGVSDEGLSDEMISEDEFAQTVEYLSRFVEQVENSERGEVTYFELATAMAFEWFQEKAVALAVVETGLGGTWDATNVVQPAVAVLTPVAVDHTEFLGTTPLENAKEKGGIIKPGAQVVSGVQEPEVERLFESLASDMRTMGKDFGLLANEPAVGGRSVGVRGLHAEYRDLFLPLYGSHQAANLCLAVAASEAFYGRELDQSSLAAAVSSMESPGRMEVVARSPLIIIDGAHNPAGAKALAESLEESFGTLKTTIVLAAFGDKDLRGIVDALTPIADRFVITKVDHPRAVEPAELEALLPKSAERHTAPSVEGALALARELSGDEDLIVATGSLYTAGQARDLLLGPVT